MNQRTMRSFRWLIMLLAGATLFQTAAFTGANGIGGGGCTTFTTNGVLTSVDFCYIFDCQSGFLGGAVQPCGDPNSTADDIFVDCSASTSTTTQ